MRNPLKRRPEPIPKQEDEEDEAFSDEPEEEQEEEIKSPTKKSPTKTENVAQQIVEREINLSLVNDKLNYIITLLNKFSEE